MRHLPIFIGTHTYRCARSDQWSNKSVDRDENLCPTVEDGLEGVMFTHLCLESDSEESSWVPWNL